MRSHHRFTLRYAGNIPRGHITYKTLSTQVQTIFGLILVEDDGDDEVTYYRGLKCFKITEMTEIRFLHKVLREQKVEMS